MAFQPYLFFGGNCRAAFTRYHEIFGGDLTLLTFKDVPGDPPPDNARRVFDALSDGGSVTQALEPTFFSEAFGVCVDRFGTPWMIVGPQPAG
jgi:PhnB protein